METVFRFIVSYDGQEKSRIEAAATALHREWPVE